MVAFGDDGGFAEGPAEVGVAELGAAQALDLAGAGDGAFDQAAVGEEVFDGGEAVNVDDLIEDGQAEAFADAGQGLEEGVFATGDAFSLAVEFLLELKDLLIEVADHGQVVLERDLAQRMVFGFEEKLFPEVAGTPGLFGWGAVVGQLVGVDAVEQFGTAPDVEDALAQECARGRLAAG